jgi:hypothetical protein
MRQMRESRKKFFHDLLGSDRKDGWGHPDAGDGPDHPDRGDGDSAAQKQ